MLRLIHTAEGQFFNKTIMINFKNNAIWSEKHSLISSIIAGIIVGICLLGIVMPQTTNADFANTTTAASYVAKASNEAAKKVAKTIRVVITAYSSTPDQTDDTPFTTASGKSVGDGIVANNMLPFGTKIRIPELYGDKVFVVEDRMNRRKSDYHFDIWFSERQLAVNFGVKTAEIQVLEN
jgi:3D (Asp-Asp-Asp) domain-containing protein